MEAHCKHASHLSWGDLPTHHDNCAQELLVFPPGSGTRPSAIGVEARSSGKVLVWPRESKAGSSCFVLPHSWAIRCHSFSLRPLWAVAVVLSVVLLNFQNLCCFLVISKVCGVFPMVLFCLSTIIFLPLWGYTVFSESFTYSIDGLHWKYLSGYFQALCLFCVFGFFSSENPWVLWRSFNLRDAFFLYLRLFCILLVGHLSRWFLWPLAQQHFIPSGTYFFTFQ